jgi:hypothetical protein
LCFKQSLFDPAMFYCIDQAGVPRGFVVVHVDDLMFGIDKGTAELNKAVRSLFPFGSLEEGEFEYCGKRVKTILQDGEVHEIRVNQKTFTEGRLDPVEIDKKAQRSVNEFGEELGTNAELHDNRSAVGGLGWLAAQSRPDLAYDVSEAQRHQNAPTLEDLKKTNKAIKKAKDTAEFEHVVRKLDL